MAVWLRIAYKRYPCNGRKARVYQELATRPVTGPTLMVGLVLRSLIAPLVAKAIRLLNPKTLVFVRNGVSILSKRRLKRAPAVKLGPLIRVYRCNLPVVRCCCRKDRMVKRKWKVFFIL